MVTINGRHLRVRARITSQFSRCTWPQTWGRQSMWGRLQPARDFSPAGETRMNAAAGRAKAPPQAEARLKPAPHGPAAPNERENVKVFLRRPLEPGRAESHWHRFKRDNRAESEEAQGRSLREPAPRSMAQPA